MKIRTVLATVAAVLATWVAGNSLAADPANARSAHAARPPFPQITLPDAVSRGARAIELLGSRLPEVAAWYGKSEGEFTSLLLKDRTLRIDRRGRLFVEDELEAPLAALTPAQQTVLDGALLPLDQTFLLHSRPGLRSERHVPTRAR